MPLVSCCRFFRSQPKTVSSDESGDSKMDVSHLGSRGKIGWLFCLFLQLFVDFLNELCLNGVLLRQYRKLEGSSRELSFIVRRVTHRLHHQQTVPRQLPVPVGLRVRGQL